jgi:hypothetical protein
MTNSHDETAYSDVPGNVNLPARERPYLDSPLDDEDLARLVVRRTPFPGLMLATGVLWIIAGAAYIALWGFLRLLQVPHRSSGIWLLLGSFFFIKDGIQLICGKFRDPQVDGVISVLLGLFFIGQGFYHYSELHSLIMLAFEVFFGAVFLVPGLLVLLGRKQYLAWKAEQGT